MTLPHELAAAGAPVAHAVRLPLLLSSGSLVHLDATLHCAIAHCPLSAALVSACRADICARLSVPPSGPQEVPLAKKIVFSGLSGAIATTCIYPIDICQSTRAHAKG